MELRFTVFSDFHYSKGMYCTGLYDLRKILQRAADTRSECVLHAGDFCNNYGDSPELFRLFLQNEYGLPVFGAYGNHELEFNGNTMERVTPMLTNSEDIRFDSDGQTLPGEGQGYYFVDCKEYRLIFIDTNYSLNPDGYWEHNHAGFCGSPRGNRDDNALGPDQMTWLRRILRDTADRGLHAIIVGHATCIPEWSEEDDLIGDWKEMGTVINEANAYRARTVIMVINGHYHTNHTMLRDNVLFFDVNAAINGCWMYENRTHYQEGQNFLYEIFDSNGQKTGEEERPLLSLWEEQHTHFFTEPVSAVVTVKDAREISIEGMKTAWRFGIEPEFTPPTGCMPEITGGQFVLE